MQYSLFDLDMLMSAAGMDLDDDECQPLNRTSAVVVELHRENVGQLHFRLTRVRVVSAACCAGLVVFGCSKVQCNPRFAARIVVVTRCPRVFETVCEWNEPK